MQITRREAILFGLGAACSVRAGYAIAQDPTPWPPALRGVQNGVVTLRSDRLLEVPDSVRQAAMQDGAAPFTVARTAPTVDLAFHGNLGPNASTNFGFIGNWNGTNAVPATTCSRS